MGTGHDDFQKKAGKEVAAVLNKTAKDSFNRGCTRVANAGLEQAVYGVAPVPAAECAFLRRIVNGCAKTAIRIIATPA